MSHLKPFTFLLFFLFFLPALSFAGNEHLLRLSGADGATFRLEQHPDGTWSLLHPGGMIHRYGPYPEGLQIEAQGAIRLILSGSSPEELSGWQLSGDEAFRKRGGFHMEKGSSLRAQTLRIEAGQLDIEGQMETRSAWVEAHDRLRFNGRLSARTSEADRLLARAAGPIPTSVPTEGQAVLLGKTVQIGSRATIEAFNGADGGAVYIGGSFQGKGPLRNAGQTCIDRGAFIDVSAKGQAGTVIVWADRQTVFRGTINAKGNQQGGFVEVSGKQDLVFDGYVHVEARNGQHGTLLLDPENINIVSGTGADDNEIQDGLIAATDRPGATLLIGATTLNNFTGNLTLQAERNITIANGVSLSLSGTAGGTFTLIADANNDGTGNFSMDPAQRISAPGRVITISAVNITTGTIDVSSTTGNAGDIFLNASSGAVSVQELKAEGLDLGGDILVSINSGTGNFNANGRPISARGEFNDSGVIRIVTARGNIQTGVLDVSNKNVGEGGVVELVTLGGDVTLGGAINANAPNNAGGVVSINAAGAGRVNTGNFSITANSNGSQQGGVISIASQTGRITLAGLEARNTNGGGSVVDLKTTSGGIELTQSINADISSTASGSVVFLSSTSGPITAAANANVSVRNAGTGTAGVIDIASTGGAIELGNLTASAPSGGGGVFVANQPGSGSVRINGAIDISGTASRAAGNTQIRTQNGNIQLNNIIGTGGSGNGSLVDVTTTGNGTITISGPITTDAAQLSGSIFINAVGGTVRTQNLSSRSTAGGEGGTISVQTRGGSIFTEELTATSVTGRGGDIQLVVLNGIGAINTNNRNINTSTGGGANSSAGAVLIQAASADIRLADIIANNTGTGRGGDVAVRVMSANGPISARNIETNGATSSGAIFVQTQAGNIEVQNLSARQTGTGAGQSGTVALRTISGAISAGQVTATSVNTTPVFHELSVGSPTGGAVTVTGDVNVSSSGGNASNINIQAGTTLSVQKVLTEAPQGTGGNLTLSAAGNLAAQDLSANGRLGGEVRVQNRGTSGSMTLAALTAEGANGPGGKILIDNPSGPANVGNLSVATRGGTGSGTPAIEVNANGALTVGQVLASSSAAPVSAGQVALRASSGAPLVAQWVDAEHKGTGSSSNVELSGGSFVRLTGTFNGRAGIPASVSNMAGGTGGTIRISHPQGSASTPFIVGTPTQNGTQGAIIATATADRITPASNPNSFAIDYTLGQISIVNGMTAPTDILLSPSSIQEELPEGTLIGTLSAVDPNAGTTHTFQIVPGEDATAFQISGNQLLSAKVFDFETRRIYLVTVRVINNLGGTFTKTLTVNILNGPDAPTDILLSRSEIAENQPIGTEVGVLTAVDPDLGDTHTFTLATGDGSANNALFSISGNRLVTAATFNFEATPTLSVRIRATDNTGRFFEKAFTIRILDANDPPTGITLNPSSISEAKPNGSVVGTLTAQDEDATNTHTFTLVPGSGSADNASFSITGNQLILRTTLSFSTKNLYRIRVRATDAAGASVEAELTVTITDDNLPPTDILLTGVVPIPENGPANILVGTLSTVDPDAGDTHTYTLVAGTGSSDNGSVRIDGNRIFTTGPLDFERNRGVLSFRIRSTDQEGAFFEKAFTVPISDLNDAPTDITLSEIRMREDLAIGANIGTFRAIDQDATDTHTFALVTGAGDADNASFTIVGNALRLNTALSFSTKRNYTIRVRTTDSGGLTFEKTFGLTVLKVTIPPTDLLLSNNRVEENRPFGTLIGSLTPVNPDPEATPSYRLVAGAGAEDNGSFRISGNQLITGEVFNFEAKSVYSVRIEVNDGFDGIFAKAFTINIADANDAPTDLLLSADSVRENSPVGTVVGVLSTIDEDQADTHTYTLVAGAGSADNAAFAVTVTGGVARLTTRQVFDFETKNLYNIRLRTTDRAGTFFEKAFVIRVTDMPEPPGSLSLSDSLIAENLPAGTVVGRLSATDPDRNEVFTFSLVPGNGSTGNAAFRIQGDQLLTARPLNFEVQSVYPIRVQVADRAGLTLVRNFNIFVLDQNDPPSNLLLSDTVISDTFTPGTAVGVFTTLDEDEGDFHRYALVEGPGSTDNDRFFISGDRLFLNFRPDADITPTLSIRVSTDDRRGGVLEKVFTIRVLRGPRPLVLQLSGREVKENEPAGTPVGTLSVTGAIPGSTFTYTFVGGIGAENNNLFRIEGDRLLTAGPFNFEQKNLYTVRIRATLQQDNTRFTDLAFEINISDVPEAPTGIGLLPSSIDENKPPRSLVGILSAADEDLDDRFVFTLIPVPGFDHAAFDILADSLFTRASFNYEQKNRYQIRVQVMDRFGLTFQRNLEIAVNDVNEAPILSALRDTVVQRGAELRFNFTVSDPDTPLNRVTMEAITTNPDLTPSSGIFIVGSGSNRELVIRLTQVVGNSTVRLIANDGALSDTVAFTITVNAVPVWAALPTVERCISSTSFAFHLPTFLSDQNDAFERLRVQAEVAQATGELRDTDVLLAIDRDSLRVSTLRNVPGTVQIRLTATDPYGERATATLNVQYQAPPTVAFTTQPGCAPFAVRLVAPQVPAGSTFRWDVLDDGTQEGTGATLDFTFSGPGPFPVRLTIQTPAGCTNTGITQVQAFPGFSAAISVAQDTVMTVAAVNPRPGQTFTYRWLLDGNPISGATQATWAAKVSGAYTAIIRDQFGCEATAAAVTVEVRPTSVERLATLTGKIEIYPNPASSVVTLLLENPITGPVRVELLDATGRRVMVEESEKRAEQWETTLMLNRLPSGLYLIRILTDKGTATRRLVKE